MIEPNQLSAPRRRTLRYVAGALGVLVLLWLVAFIAAGDGVPRGTTVLGVPIGGMTPQRAEATLTRELADEAKAAVPVRVGDERLEIDPVAAGLALDAAATVDEAGQRSWNPVALVAGLLGAGDMDPSVTVDHGKLTAAVGAMAQQIDGKPVEGGVRFDGDQVVPVEPRQGRTVDRSDAVDKIGEAYLSEDLPVELSAELVEPKVGSAEVDRAVTEFAEPAMSGPVELTIDGKGVTLEPSLIGPRSGDEAQRRAPARAGARRREAQGEPRRRARAVRDQDQGRDVPHLRGAPTGRAREARQHRRPRRAQRRRAPGTDAGRRRPRGRPVADRGHSQAEHRPGQGPRRDRAASASTRPTTRRTSRRG